MSDIELILNTLYSLIGDTPVSEQLGVALDRMAIRNHEHDNYATRDEIKELSKKIEILANLVGDTPVSEQINSALKNN